MSAKVPRGGGGAGPFLARSLLILRAHLSDHPMLFDETLILIIVLRSLPIAITVTLNHQGR